ncbi:hypothetical protein [Amaricoccus solimangrovi]|uniref:Uncharacterized protein n=1 Tax=Amaricoccus solimangrovi TaxID=2589815 RepID=A0A501WYY8_9RHOB|nr:hypothetical protein [Amaricoccus solimangrovi]TPE53544.1 hypothetical protein FJM51_00375 [Amaricoccus solimangrovi]
MKISHVLVVAGGLLAAAGASFAADGQTLGERLANGSMTQQRFNQLIPFTGLTPDQAKALTLDEVVSLRWQDS